MREAHHIIRCCTVGKAPHAQHISWEALHESLGLLDVLHVLLWDLKDSVQGNVKHSGSSTSPSLAVSHCQRLKCPALEGLWLLRSEAPQAPDSSYKSNADILRNKCSDVRPIISIGSWGRKRHAILSRSSHISLRGLPMTPDALMVSS